MSIVSAPASYDSNSEGKNKSLELISGDPMQVWIDCDEVENLLNVTQAPIQSQKPNQPLLSTHINLSSILLDSMYVGFSSATGMFRGNHYILGWSFNKSGQAQNLDLSKLPSLPSKRKPRQIPSLDITVSLITVSIVLIVVILGTIYFVWRKKYEEIPEDWEQEYGPQRFFYKDLYKATKGFNDEELLGRGGFGKYLHEEWEQVVHHRDVKASNVSLDAELNGRLRDFGLNRLYDHGANPETTHVVGTVGFLAPELTRTGKATASTDVFAFGAFMLEVACERRPIVLQGLPQEIILVDWVFEKWKQGSILETSDPRLGGDYLEADMLLVLKLGMLCSQYNEAKRCSMRQMMQYLDGNVLLPDIPLHTAGMGTFSVTNETSSEFVALFPLFVSKSFVQLLFITESILNSSC
ncbi:hypothetical protein ACSBR1_002363 [Camellia fascicularis]